MDVEALTSVAPNAGVAVAVVVFLWKGLLPEVRAMRRELTAIEKHLSAAGEGRTRLELAARAAVDRLEERLHELGKGVDFLVSVAQQRNGRTTRPTDAPDEAV